MEISQIISCVDAHTAGTPIRVILSGIPPLKGESINDKMIYMQENFDHLRVNITNPFRSPPAMVCAVLVPPSAPGVDYGVFFMDSKSYQPMCGAGTFSVAKTLIETGMVVKRAPITEITLETPSGIVKVFIDIENNEVRKISLINVPSFLYMKDIILETGTLGKLKVDIGFGGNFFAIVDTSLLPLPLFPENKSAYKEYMRIIVDACEEQIIIKHPTNPNIDYLNQVLFYKNTPDANGGYTCQCIFGDAILDISPCGTGTCARLAQKFARGELNLQEQFIQNSLWGSSFRATALKEAKVGDYSAIIPLLTCDDARITGFNKLIIEANDIHQLHCRC